MAHSKSVVKYPAIGNQFNMLNRLKPYLVILFALWPLVTIGMKYALNDGIERAQFEIAESARITGSVIKATESMSKRSHIFWVYAEVPPTMGKMYCDGPISESTYRNISEHGTKTVDFYVWKTGCWTVEDKDRRANLTDQDSWFFASIISLIPSFLFYLVFAIIPFGKSRLSLNRRWAAKDT